jgi:hypothetical protein
MYLAEIHGKLSNRNENKEDILTSNVFSFFKYANREIFLYNFVKALDFEVSVEDARQAEFQFWPSYPDGTEPDLVILIGPYCLLVEAKFHSGFGNHQLAREIKNGLIVAHNLDKEFHLIIVTADYFNRGIIQEVEDDDRHYITWINWQTIALLIYNQLDKALEIQNETRLFAEDLYQLFLKKNLRSFEGVNVLSQSQTIHYNQGDIFFQARTAIYRGDFIGFIQSLETINKLTSVPSTLFYRAEKTFFQLFRKSDNLLTINTGNLFFNRR